MFEGDDAADEAEGEEAVDQRTAELGRSRELVIEMQRLGVERERREQHVVGLGHRARERVLYHEADGELLVPLAAMGSCHRARGQLYPRRTRRPGSAPVSSPSRNV